MKWILTLAMLGLMTSGCATWGRGVYTNCDQVANHDKKEWACDKPFWSR